MMRYIFVRFLVAVSKASILKAYQILGASSEVSADQGNGIDANCGTCQNCAHEFDWEDVQDLMHCAASGSAVATRMMCPSCGTWHIWSPRHESLVGFRRSHGE
jgi:heterodisulfide reductase subunit A-like polyferredoxin